MAVARVASFHVSNPFKPLTENRQGHVHRTCKPGHALRLGCDLKARLVWGGIRVYDVPLGVHQNMVQCRMNGIAGGRLERRGRRADSGVNGRGGSDKRPVVFFRFLLPAFPTTADPGQV